MKANDKVNSAWDEYVIDRCEEIIANDEYCNNLNREIIKLEQELLPLLSHEALGKFLKIDELSLELTDRIREICTDNFTIIR